MGVRMGGLEQKINYKELISYELTKKIQKVDKS
jgi:hypothetical protein